MPFLALAGFDLRSTSAQEARRLLQGWTASIGRLGDSRRTVTIGFGPSMFDRVAELADRRPGPLQPLPPFPGEAIDDRASHGDICVQVCATTPAAAADGLRTLLNIARPQAGLRWRQFGYRDQDGTADPRNPFGFRDGTANLDLAGRDLWVSDGNGWMNGGTYLVMRRIRLLLDTWDRTALADQEAMIGRAKGSGDRIGAGHAGLAAPGGNNGATMLRRSYSYDGGVDVNGLQDSGLIFLAYQRDPGRQFVPVQRRLAAGDPLNAFSQHVASGVFACPPASFLGEGLLL
ncbi:hypothetical protein GCM10010435_60220 [Winogradskya consettensis]|uniref:Dyp-type peroxidase n=2 Tax=Winogradskya consettensis TaxID=113560 RepID=A0A919VUL7_9ACTN|nr:hypothetical protein Aco04nite_50340 [Actinoplanes consettensis]